MKKIFTLIAAAFVAASVNAQTITFTEAKAKGTLDGATFGTGFVLTVTDKADGGKLTIDANSQYFGTEADWTKYGFRLKTGGKSDSKNALKLTVPTAGQLVIAMRSSSSSDTRTVAFKQGDNEIASFEVKDDNATKGNIEGEEGQKTIFNFYTIESVPAGDINITYNGGTNFYGFNLITSTGILTLIPEEVDAPAYNLQGQRVDENYRGVVIKNGKKVVIK